MPSAKKRHSGRILAIYTHCNNHILNWSIAGAVKVGVAENIVQAMTAIDIFFNYSPKREGLLEHVNTNESNNSDWSLQNKMARKE